MLCAFARAVVVNIALFEGYRIVPLTAIGRATATLLRLNSPERLRVRSLLYRLGKYPVQ
jgi:hypothetical protein